MARQLKTTNSSFLCSFFLHSVRQTFVTVYSALGVTPIIYGSMALLQIDFFLHYITRCRKKLFPKKN